MKYQIFFTPVAGAMLKSIPDRRWREKIGDRIEELAEGPETQGKPLSGALAGCRSVRVSQRYRVIYKVEKGKVLVIVLALGMRKAGDKKDIYDLAKKIIRAGLA